MNIVNAIGKYKTGSWYQRDASTITKIVVHHTAIPLKNYTDDTALLKYVQQIHEGHGWPGLSYHFLITGKGSIYQLNDFSDVTWHDGVNYSTLSVCLNGYFHPEVNDKPTASQLKALDWLLDELCTNHPEFPADHDDVVGHRDMAATACPGNNLYPYVLEYKAKKGVVSWGNAEDTSTVMKDTDSELDKLMAELDGVRASRNSWRTKYEQLDADTTKEMQAKIKHIEELQKTIAELNAQLTVNTGGNQANLDEIERLREEVAVGKDDILVLKDLLDESKKENKRLAGLLSRCKEENKEVSGFIAWLKKLFGGGV